MKIYYVLCTFSKPVEASGVVETDVDEGIDLGMRKPLRVQLRITSIQQLRLQLLLSVATQKRSLQACMRHIDGCS